MATRKTTQIDLALERIADPATREVLSQLVDMVGAIAGRGISTQGKVHAQGGIETANGGAFKVKLFNGTLAASDYQDHIVSGVIVGAIGYSQVQGTEAWRQINRGAVGSGPYIEALSNGAVDRLRVVNGDVTNANGYRVAIFYIG